MVGGRTPGFLDTHEGGRHNSNIEELVAFPVEVDLGGFPVSHLSYPSSVVVLGLHGTGELASGIGLHGASRRENGNGKPSGKRCSDKTETTGNGDGWQHGTGDGHREHFTTGAMSGSTGNTSGNEQRETRKRRRHDTETEHVRKHGSSSFGDKEAAPARA